MLIRIIKDKTIYPYSENQLRQDTGAMFEREIAADVLAKYGVYPVTPTPQPAYSPAVELVAEVTPVKQKDGSWSQAWEVCQRYATQAERDAALQAELARVQGVLADQIDAAVAEACAKPQRFTEEYKRREAQARAYISTCDAIPKPASGTIKLPDPPPLIAGFAKAAGMAGYDAARLTVAQADDLYAKLDQLADLRMRKYEVKRAPTLAAAQAAFESIMASIRTVAATIT